MRKLVTLSGKDGLYKISIEKSFFNGDILAATFAKVSATTFLTLGTQTILKSFK